MSVTVRLQALLSPLHLQRTFPFVRFGSRFWAEDCRLRFEADGMWRVRLPGDIAHSLPGVCASASPAHSNTPRWFTVTALESVVWTWVAAVRVACTSKSVDLVEATVCENGDSVSRWGVCWWGTSWRRTSGGRAASDSRSVFWLISLHPGRSDGLVRQHIAALPVAKPHGQNYTTGLTDSAQAATRHPRTRISQSSGAST